MPQHVANHNKNLTFMAFLPELNSPIKPDKMIFTKFGIYKPNQRPTACETTSQKKVMNIFALSFAKNADSPSSELIACLLNNTPRIGSESLNNLQPKIRTFDGIVVFHNALKSKNKLLSSPESSIVFVICL